MICISILDLIYCSKMIFKNITIQKMFSDCQKYFRNARYRLPYFFSLNGPAQLSIQSADSFESLL